MGGRAGPAVIVLDTHAWVWLLSEPEQLSTAAREVISAEHPVLSAISCWELATLVRLGRLSLDRDTWAWVSHALRADPSVQVVGLGPEIAVAAGELGELFPGDPADRIIYATARALGCRLVTKDRRIRQFAPADTIWD